MNLKTIKKCLKLMGLANLITCAFVVYMTFWCAWQNPDLSCTIYINNYNEATPELIALAFLLPWTLYAIFSIIEYFTRVKDGS